MELRQGGRGFSGLGLGLGAGLGLGLGLVLEEGDQKAVSGADAVARRSVYTRA